MHQHHQRLRQNRDSPPLLPPPPLDTRGGFGTFGAFTRGTSTLGAVNGITVWGHRFEFAGVANETGSCLRSTTVQRPCRRLGLVSSWH